MSAVEVVKEMAPKRRRMMDMVLTLGGLKEESAVPVSRIAVEIENLRRGIGPLIEPIVAFPSSYFDAFLETATRTGLLAQIAEKSILVDSIANLEKAAENLESKGLLGLLDALRLSLAAKKRVSAEQRQASVVDIDSILKSIPDVIARMDSVVGEYEEKAKANAVGATAELNALIESLSQATSSIESSPDTTLDALQKLGTKTRYGPFLRASAQIKRGRREGRIEDSRVLQLVSVNALTELHRGIILFILSSMGSKTAVQLATLMRVSPETVQSAIISMIQRGEIEMAGLEGDSPVFARVLAATPPTTLVLKRVIQQFRGVVRSLKGSTQDSAKASLDKLGPILEKLQLLGEYDETKLSDHVDTLRKTVDSMTVGVLQSQGTGSSDDLRLLVSAGLEAFTRFRLKIALEKGPKLVSEANVYGEKLNPETYDRMVATYLDNELERGMILVLIRDIGAMTAHDLAERTHIPQNRVFQHLLRLKSDELLTAVGESHGYVLYDVPRTPNEAEITIRTVSSLAPQLSAAKAEINSILSDFKAQDIGRLVGSLDAFSKSCDKMLKIRVGGQVIAEPVLKGVEEKIKSAVLLAYRARAKIPSAKPKVTIDDLVEIDVPSVLDEYRDMMGYAPLLGFGTIDWESSRCLGCKSCQIACPEHAIELKSNIDVPSYFDFPEEALQKLPVNKALFYRTVRSLAAVRPTISVPLKRDAPGFGKVEVDLWLCVACLTCVRRCPGPESGALELELKWSLPEVVRQMTAKA
jgi:ferredoxin/DNA-binding MarR family transcriptional regulator